jgi:hypothetical protein
MGWQCDECMSTLDDGQSICASCELLIDDELESDEEDGE